MPASAPRILLVKFGAIGDAVMLLPAAHALHTTGPAIDWVCGPAILPLLRLYPWINPIVADDRAILTGSALSRLQAIAAIWRTLAGRPYTLAATLYYDPRYRILTLPVRARRKLQLSQTDRTLRLLPGRHHTDEYARILLNWPDEHRPTPLPPVAPTGLPASPLARGSQRRVILAPAGAKNMLADDTLRRWPAEDYVALAGLLIRQGIEVVLIGGPDDAWVQSLFDPLARENFYDRIGLDPLPETLALLDEADVLVTHDTGPLHLAGITRVGIVSLFGPTDPHGRLPQRPGTVALWGGEGFACRPCYDAQTFAPCPRNDCLRQLTPTRVLAEVIAMLQDRAHSIYPAPRIAT